MVSKRQQDEAFDRARRMNDDLERDMAPDQETIGKIDESESERELTEKDIIDAVNMGAAQKTVTIMGHDVTFSLLNTRREIQTGQLTRSASDAVRPMAIRTAYFALSVQSIDGIPFYVPIAADGSEHIARYQKALDYYDAFISQFWNEYLKLRAETDEELDKLGK